MIVSHLSKADEINPPVKEHSFVMGRSGLVEINTDPNCIDLTDETVCIKDNSNVKYKKIDEPLEFTKKGDK